MPKATHQHHAVHTTTQVAAVDPTAARPALPPWAQTPFALTFAPCFLTLSVLAIRHRIKLHRRGERFTRTKTKPAQLIGGMLLIGGLFFLRDKFPAIESVLDWPDRTFPYYRAHGVAMWLGFLAAGLAMQMVSALFAVIFLHSRPSRGQGVRVAVPSGYNMLPTPPPGCGWCSQPETTTRIIGTRTTTYEE